MKKLKILLTDLNYLDHNYGAQAIAFTFIEKFRKVLKSDFIFVLPSSYYKKDKEFARKNHLSIISTPGSAIILSDPKYYPYNLFFIPHLIYRYVKILLKQKIPNSNEILDNINNSDCIIDLSGIEFVGNASSSNKIWSFLNSIYFQILAEKYQKIYIKYTKSYGPFNGFFYKLAVRYIMNKLPFIFVRGKRNLNNVKKLGIKPKIYLFPDISLAMKPADKKWAISYLSKLGLSTKQPIVGISPSAVIGNLKGSESSSCGQNHLELCIKLIEYFQGKGRQIILLPHSVGDGVNAKSCDLAYSKEIFKRIKNKDKVFLIEDKNLNYPEVRSIIGLLDIYITGRYHSVASALFMATPVICFSWHVKYKDLISDFLEDYLVMDCQTININQAFDAIIKYNSNRKWFNREKVLKKKNKIISQIDNSINILADYILKQI